VGALLAAIVGSDAYAGEKERGTLVPLLCTPVSPTALLGGKALGLFGVWAIMLVTASPYLWAVGAAGQNLGAALLYLALFGTPVVLGFGLLAMAASARTGSVLASLLIMVALLLVMSAPLWFGAGLRQTVIGRIMDAVNPFAGALNTFDSVIIDGQPLMTQAGRLAVVAVWLGLCGLAARRGTAHPTFS
jgi:ABC-type transport system involved in multi-copper enzyme maturation permease subunit